MAEVVIADILGFCSGVRKAINKALKSKNSNSLGQIVHNKDVMKRLEKKGIKSVDDIEQAESKGLIIRAHGISKDIIDRAEKKGFEIIDTTCVKIKHLYAVSKKLESKGYRIVLLGDREHPEVKGAASRLENPIIINSAEEAEDIGFYGRIGFLSQTTQSNDKFKKISKILRSKCNDLAAENTICDATKKRQDAAARLAKEVDLMIVIGGRNSANTKQLYKLCSKYCKSVHIENKEDIDFEINGKIGITAGASTPDFVINEVVDKIKCL